MTISISSNLLQTVRSHAKPFTDMKHIIAQIPQTAEIVLIGEASHGTKDFYEFRSVLTKMLIEERGFSIVACEADWPDMDRLNRYINVSQSGAKDETVEQALSDFERFPKWMWRNSVVAEFAEWAKNSYHRVKMAGLDLYSMFRSIEEVLKYLSKMDEESQKTAREFYTCFSNYEQDPQRYAIQATLGISPGCQNEAINCLKHLVDKRQQLIEKQLQETHDQHDNEADGPVKDNLRNEIEELQFKAEINALVARDAEEYYRIAMFGGSQSWNKRDEHMVDVLTRLIEYEQTKSSGKVKAVVWAHNSHLGDARYTKIGSRGRQLNIGQLCKEKWGDGCYNIGQLTYTGTVTCASDWDGHELTKHVVPALSNSWEFLLHAAIDEPIFFLPCKDENGKRISANEQLWERYIGVIYRPETEFESHYSETKMGMEYDLVVFHNETRALGSI